MAKKMIRKQIEGLEFYLPDDHWPVQVYRGVCITYDTARFHAHWPGKRERWPHARSYAQIRPLKKHIDAFIDALGFPALLPDDRSPTIAVHARSYGRKKGDWQFARLVGYQGNSWAASPVIRYEDGKEETIEYHSKAIYLCDSKAVIKKLNALEAQKLKIEDDLSKARDSLRKIKRTHLGGVEVAHISALAKAQSRRVKRRKK